ncbi:hypothetical protein [Streptomyces phytophilus]|uniref:hypothetical protein n=1 Tax=Streptomyces phytophilus TaxID=722715 RepID=UPI0015EFE3F7|nr:hypothetical protein [Streptomyces phytophilus]
MVADGVASSYAYHQINPVDRPRVLDTAVRLAGTKWTEAEGPLPDSLPPLTLRRLVTDAARIAAQPPAETAPKEPIDVRARRYAEEESRRERTGTDPTARGEAAAAAARGRQAEAAARDLLARAGLPGGADEVKITTLLLLHREEVTQNDVRLALRAFEDAYARRTRRATESGGTYPWPTTDSVITSLFGPR